ncbi:MAG: electron transport complex subunit RsxC [Bacteroidales bacterium]
MPKTFSRGGIHPSECKLSTDKPTRELPLPGSVVVPLSQHIGALPSVVVKVGDVVKTGQLLATGSGFVSSNLHSPVSGTVKKIDNLPDAGGYKRPAIQIERDGDIWLDEIDRSETLVKEIRLSSKEIQTKIAAAGIVGLGGATFPTHVKLAVPPGKVAELVVVNGVECEPYLTCDHRLMLEKGAEIMVGVSLLMKALGVGKAIIGIEENKPDAIALLTTLAGGFQGITVQKLKVKYPQGGEKQLIEALTGKEVPSGKIPVDVGVVPFNIASVFAVYEAVQKNKPLIERIITVTGPEVKEPSNLKVRIGTPIREVIGAAGDIPQTTGKIIAGGPMMGRTLVTVDAPVTKGVSGLLLLPASQARRAAPQACIRCGKCVEVCPMGLEPYLLERLSAKELYERAEDACIVDCIECGSCQYTCPANRPLLDRIRLGKAATLRLIKSRRS